MTKNKQRLYLAAYDNREPGKKQNDRFHWAFLIGPKFDRDANGVIAPSERFILKMQPGVGRVLQVEETTDLQNSGGFLARFVIAKIKDAELVRQIIREAPIEAQNLAWTSEDWAPKVLVKLSKEAGSFKKALSDGSKLDWSWLRKAAEDFIDEKMRQPADPGLIHPEFDPPTLQLITRDFLTNSEFYGPLEDNQKY